MVWLLLRWIDGAMIAAREGTVFARRKEIDPVLKRMGNGLHATTYCENDSGQSAVKQLKRWPNQKGSTVYLSHGKIVEVEIGGVSIYRPFVEFRLANSYCHLYGAQGLGQR
ncbi:hypothetical protein TNCV_1228811 [Trichonephila clavipes]|nr:hypothetical protein TNCV_1228811 [Trichonephila clavipes]